ncbi:MAG: glycosyltransferase family 4 protein [Candidatus Eremiobacteraeota bacterium]|nr:glycosyltransferase family 4 protein [Candidatus Eremiobacteraeota bacterium]
MSTPVVALDARLTRQMSVGMKAYVRELVARLPAQAADLQFLVFSNEELQVPSSNARLVRVSAFTSQNGAIGEQLVYPAQLRRSGPDLIHYMSVYAPRRSQLAHVYTIHDLIHLRFPNYFSWKVPPYYRFIVGPIARSARTVITDASATIADLRRFLGVALERARVIPLGVAETFRLDDDERTRLAGLARSRFGLERPYFLYAGNHRPHKNLQTLCEAWYDLLALPCDLVVTGDGPLGYLSARGKKTNGKLHLTGHVSMEDLVSLYAGCVASVQPSLYEGFGLSVLEAMASGAPAIVAQTPALLEVGGDAVATFPPTDAAALASIMTLVLSDAYEASRLRNAGRERVRAFSWDATARATVDVYREALRS